MGSVLFILTQYADHTADYLCVELAKRGRTFVRLNTDSLPAQFSVHYVTGAPVLTMGDYHLQPSEVAHLWYRRPRPLRLPGEPAADSYEQKHIELEWTEALEGVLAHIPVDRWMNHPAFNALASHKMEQLTRAARLGFAVPTTLVTQEVQQLRRFWDECGGYVIAKPLASGYIERDKEEDDTAIYTSAVSVEHVENAASVERCPTLLQRRITKKVDVRVTVVDGEAIAVGLRAKDRDTQRLDIRRNNMADVQYEHITLPPDTRARILRLVRSYNLRFAALDFCVDERGDWVFFELNPNGQWAWMDIVGVSDIASAFDRAFFGAE